MTTTNTHWRIDSYTAAALLECFLQGHDPDNYDYSHTLETPFEGSDQQRDVSNLIAPRANSYRRRAMALRRQCRKLRAGSAEQLIEAGANTDIAQGFIYDLQDDLKAAQERVAELEAKLADCNETRHRISESHLTLEQRNAELEAACRASEQCIVDFLEVYKRGAAMLVLDEAVKSLRDDALRSVRKALTRIRA